MLGPLPASNFYVQFRITSVSVEMQNIEFGNYNALTKQVDSRNIALASLASYTDADGATWDFRIGGFETAAFCASFVSCGECTVQPECAMCGGACVSSTRAELCPITEEFTPQGSCCATCTFHSTADTCIASPGCGWCAAEGACVSGTATTACRACLDDAAPAKRRCGACAGRAAARREVLRNWAPGDARRSALARLGRAFAKAEDGGAVGREGGRVAEHDQPAPRAREGDLRMHAGVPCGCHARERVRTDGRMRTCMHGVHVLEGRVAAYVEAARV